MSSSVAIFSTSSESPSPNMPDSPSSAEEYWLVNCWMEASCSRAELTSMSGNSACTSSMLMPLVSNSEICVSTEAYSVRLPSSSPTAAFFTASSASAA